MNHYLSTKCFDFNEIHTFVFLHFGFCLTNEQIVTYFDYNITKSDGKFSKPMIRWDYLK